MINNYYQKGSSIKLNGRFADYADNTNTIYPEEVRLTLYDYKWDQIFTIIVNDIDENGFYFYSHTFNDVGTFYYEWLGLINGMPSLQRKTIYIKQV